MNTHIEKIAFGSNVEISAIKSKARIPIIYGNGNTGSINISIENRDRSRVRTITFPLIDKQTLSENDYIGPDGLHIGEEKIEFNDEQILAYESLQDIYLYPEYTHIYCTDETLATMKVYYYSINGKDNQIYVMDKEEQLIAVFNKEDEDTLINPRIQKTQNGESIFTFSIDLHNPKWEQISNPENLYRVDDMVFSTNFDTSFQETISENDEKLMSVTAYERQKLLTRKFVRAWNSTTNIGDGTDASIDTFMVVILSKGDLPLKNNDRLVYEENASSKHNKGTSGYALDALLYGTDWTTGICDAGLYNDENENRIFDLETDQLSIYENILKVQEIWGGILVFDSVNKIVHHRDETLWLPYQGYEVKYRKNMQSLEKVYNNKIITKLCPLGEGGLNIKTAKIKNSDGEEVDYGDIWLTDFSYTTSELEGIENNPDITDPTQLMKWGKRKLKDLCKPSKELTVETILLYQVEGYELETIDLNDVVDVINYNEIQGETEQLRVVSFEYGVWDKSDAIIELSDITLESTDIFRKTVSATNSINAGTLSSSKVVTYYKNGQSIDSAIKEMDSVIESNTTLLTKDEEGLVAQVKKLTTDYNTITSDMGDTKTQMQRLEMTVDGIKSTNIVSGGSNLIKNSVGFFGNEYWEGNAVGVVDTDIRLYNESDGAFELQNGTIYQEIKDIKNGQYNLSFNYKVLKKSVTDENQISHNVTVTAEISDVVTYTVVWQNEDKTILDTNHLAYGTIPQYNGEPPQKQSTEEYKYIFIGWTPEILEVTKDITYTALYREVPIDEIVEEEPVPEQNITEDTYDESTKINKITLSNTEWTRVEKKILITDNKFYIAFNSTHDKTCYISDLILCVGENRQTWSQNSNETVSDSVTIGKGIEVRSSVKNEQGEEQRNFYTRIDYDGNRVYKTETDSGIDEVVTEMTDEGIITETLKTKGQAEINILYISQIGNQVWLTGI